MIAPAESSRTWLSAGVITNQGAGLLAVCSFALGLLAGACLVAIALSYREVSLNAWAAALQRRERFEATDSAGTSPTCRGDVPARTSRRRPASC